MNYLDIQNNFLTVAPYRSDVSEIIDGLNEYILAHECERMNVDISVLTMLDAIRVSAVCSTYHFAKYPFGSIEWIVRDLETRNTLRTYMLKTVHVSVKKPIIKNLYTPTISNVVSLR